MRLPLEEIPEDGLSVEVTVGDVWALEAARIALEGTIHALSGALQIQPRIGDLMVEGRLDAAAARTCDRCGHDVLLRIEDDLEFVYLPSLPKTNEDGSIQSSELNLGVYEEGVLDLALVVQEHFALILPFKITCDSPGVTRVSGEPCSPDTFRPPERIPDSRFAVLAQLKLGMRTD